MDGPSRVVLEMARTMLNLKTYFALRTRKAFGDCFSFRVTYMYA